MKKENSMDFTEEKEYFLSGKINEECGCFGLFNVADAASLSYFGLHALQHRGQEAAGIAASDGETIRTYKGKGLLTEVFNNDIIASLPGRYALGHVRYSKADANQKMLSRSWSERTWDILQWHITDRSSMHRN